MFTSSIFFFFFFNATATTEIYTLSLHDALPISASTSRSASSRAWAGRRWSRPSASASASSRSEEHTSELQSQFHLVCRLLLEKKKESEHRRLLAGPAVDRIASAVVVCAAFIRLS